MILAHARVTTTLGAILVCAHVGRGGVPTDCESSSAQVREYIAVIARLADTGFTDEAQLKRLTELLGKRPEDRARGYYVYTSVAIASCSIVDSRTARVFVRYDLAGHVVRRPKTPKALPDFYKMDGSPSVVLRIHDGLIYNTDANDPFYPPIVAIQDYRERTGSSRGPSNGKNEQILRYLEASQVIYLARNKSAEQ